jgi:hypothetical protein
MLCCVALRGSGFVFVFVFKYPSPPSPSLYIVSQGPLKPALRTRSVRHHHRSRNGVTHPRTIQSARIPMDAAVPSAGLRTREVGVEGDARAGCFLVRGAVLRACVVAIEHGRGVDGGQVAGMEIGIADYGVSVVGGRNGSFGCRAVDARAT